MSCVPIKMTDGTVVLANVKPGEALTDEEKAAIAEYVQFCRDRKARRERTSLAQGRGLAPAAGNKEGVGVALPEGGK